MKRRKVEDRKRKRAACMIEERDTIKQEVEEDGKKSNSCLKIAVFPLQINRLVMDLKG